MRNYQLLLNICLRTSVGKTGMQVIYAIFDFNFYTIMLTNMNLDGLYL